MASIGFLEIFLSFIAFLVLFWLRNNDGLPMNWPFFGMLPALLLQVHRTHDWCTEVLEKCNFNTFLFIGPWFGNMDMLITADPANVHYIMSSNFSDYPKGSEFKEIFDVLGDGIFNSDRELWKNQRRVAQTFMSHKEFHKSFVKTIKDKVEKGLLPVLQHACSRGQVVDFQDVFQRFMFDATCKFVTGSDPGCLSIEFPEVGFSKAISTAEETIFFRHVLPERIWKLQRWLGIGKEKKLCEAWKVLDDMAAQIISAKKQSFLTQKINNFTDDDQSLDLLTAYVKEDDASQIDDKFLRDTIVNFLLAGTDTTSSALSWFFYLLSNNPEAETKITEELKAILPQRDGESWEIFEADKLKRLVYLHGALCETLRLYPPVPFEHKSPLRTDTLPSGHEVSPKMKILFPLYAMGRMSAIWGKDCSEFKPERWINEKGGIKHEPSYKFLAFNAGPRTCLGKEVAFTQMKAVTAVILHNYQVEVLDGQKVSPCLSIILHMKHGIKVRLAKRCSSTYTRMVA